MIELKSVGPGVITARTLLSEDALCVAVRVLCCTDDPVKLAKDVCVGTSLPAQVYESVPGVETADSDLRRLSATERADLQGYLSLTENRHVRQRCRWIAVLFHD